MGKQISVKSVYVMVCLTVDEDTDIEDLVNEMDYDFDHPNIKEFEILDVVPAEVATN